MTYTMIQMNFIDIALYLDDFASVSANLEVEKRRKRKLQSIHLLS